MSASSMWDVATVILNVFGFRGIDIPFSKVAATWTDLAALMYANRPDLEHILFP